MIFQVVQVLKPVPDTPSFYQTKGPKVMNDNKKILVGKIVAFQGVRGDVRIQTYTENPADFQKFKIQSSKFKELVSLEKRCKGKHK